MSLPEPTSPSVRASVLTRKIAAIQVGEESGPQLGLFTELPAGHRRRGL
jgi:hypothetical protein